MLNEVPESLHSIDAYKKTKTNVLTKNAEKPKIGDLGSDFELKNRRGGKASLSGFEGKYKLLEFSFSGCGPCLQALPEVKEAYEKYNDQLEVLTIWKDPTRDIWLNSSKKT